MSTVVVTTNKRANERMSNNERRVWTGAGCVDKGRCVRQGTGGEERRPEEGMPALQEGESAG